MTLYMVYNYDVIFASPRFANASDPREADMIFQIVISQLNGNYVLCGGGTPYSMRIACDEVEGGGVIGARNVMFHELLHTLGVGHAHGDHPYESWELMASLLACDKMYPSTLDLYGEINDHYDAGAAGMRPLLSRCVHSTSTIRPRVYRHTL